MSNLVVEEDLKHIYAGFLNRDCLKGSTILITGCAGFLGFYFIHFLLRYAQELDIKQVIGLDNFKIERPTWLELLINAYPQQLNIHDFDVAQDALVGVPGIAQVDYIVHMASIASPVYYRRYPLATIDANIWGLRSLLDYFKTRPVKGFLFFSSSEIYGDPPVSDIPTVEEYRGHVSCVGPRACYDESKRFGETLCYVYAQEHAMPITVVRPFNNFGPGMRLEDRRIPADFAKAILEGRDIVLFSDGTPTRTFCYVTDAIAGYLQALTYGHFDYFNIGIDRPEVSMNDFALLCVKAGKDIFNYTGQVRKEIPQEKDYLTHNPARRSPCIDKARRLLKFDPTISVEVGVRRFFEFLRTSKVCV